MAYPPALPPSNRQDSTLAAGNHAADHNALVTALADLIAELGADPAGGYSDVTSRLADVPTAATIAGRLEGRVAPATHESAPLGAELVTAAGWTPGAGWAGTAAAGYTHTAGTAPLTWAPATPFIVGESYLVEFTVDSPTNSSAFTVTLGGSFGPVMYEGAAGGTHRYSRGIKALTNAPLTFVPESTFDGTIRNVSVRQVINSYAAPTVWLDSTGATALEVRATKASLDNAFIGKEAGRYNVTGKQNVALGAWAMRSSTSGFWNVAVGYSSLRDNTNGTRNVALGFLALTENLSGHRNIAIGPFALTRNTDGIANIGLGADVLWYNRTGNYNIALGQAALGESISGDANVAIGRGALGHSNGMSNHIAIGDYASWELNSEATGNTVAIGRRALRNATAGGNLAVGFEAGLGLTTGNGHTIVGHEALQATDTALNCVAIGRYAIRNVTGEYNTAVGMNAMGGTAAGTAKRNTAVGYGTLTALQTGGDYNVAIGSSAGATTTTGANNILIGYNAQAIGPTDSYYLNLGNTLYGYMTGNKRLGAGVSNPTAGMHLRAGAASANGAPLKFTAGGALLTTPEAGAVEYDGTDLWLTNGAGVRRKLALV